MKIHSIRLHPKPFLKIKAGVKIIESRLNDEKRQLFEAGDRLIFTSRQDGEEISTTITDMHHHPSFAKLFSSVSLDKFAETDFNILLTEITEFYSTVDQEKWGVVGIEFKINLN